VLSKPRRRQPKFMGGMSRSDHAAALSQSGTASGKPHPALSSEAMSRELRVQLVDDEIIVTLPGFRYSVTYYKPHKSPQLIAKNIARRSGLLPPGGTRC
jgi:hypothetical protein